MDRADLRMLGGQRCSNFAGNAVLPPTIARRSGWRAPMSYVPSLPFPDAAVALAGQPYRLDPRLFVQGYECAGGCSTITALGTYSAESLTAGQRVPRSDVLTIRYQAGSGWPVGGACSASGVGVPTCGGDVISRPADRQRSGADDRPDRRAGFGLCGVGGPAGVGDGGNDSATSFTIGPGVLAGAPKACATAIRPPTCACSTGPVRHRQLLPRLPYQRGSMAASAASMPTLVRRVNDGAPEDIVQGVDQLDFLYGVLGSNGMTRYLTAAEIDADRAVHAAAGRPVERCRLPVARRAQRRALLINSTDGVRPRRHRRSFRHMGATITWPPTAARRCRPGRSPAACCAAVHRPDHDPQPQSLSRRPP